MGRSGLVSFVLALGLLALLGCGPDGPLSDGNAVDCSCLVFRDSGNERALGGSWDGQICLVGEGDAQQIAEDECVAVYEANNTISDNHSCECECIRLDQGCFSKDSTLTDARE
jgi:hypothetical protein